MEDAMTEPERILSAASSILVVDWPSRDVPETLARAGYSVVVKGGPEPDSYQAQEVRDGEVVPRSVGPPPDHADIVYSHRPLAELPGIVRLATDVGATTVWCQSGLASAGVDDPKGCWVPEDESRQARSTVESAGLAYIEDAYIADVARLIRP
jgi:predicted CoA-binding protein